MSKESTLWPLRRRRILVRALPFLLEGMAVCYMDGSCLMNKMFVNERALLADAEFALSERRLV